MMLRVFALVALLGGLVACAGEPAQAPEAALPLPPSPPPRPHGQRQAARPPASTDVAAATTAPVAVAPTEDAVVPVAAAHPPVWRVARDGVVGCADRAALAALTDGAERTPRSLAETRANGGCRTTFRVNEWVAEGSEADAMRLRLTNGAALTLWFRRSELVAP